MTNSKHYTRLLENYHWKPSRTHLEGARNSIEELEKNLERACRLIDHMASYIGQMAPGRYSDFYRDLNEHGLFQQKLVNQGSIRPDKSRSPDNLIAERR